VENLTTRNLVIVALLQVGVIVGGVLAAVTSRRWHAVLGHLPPSQAAAFLADYGFLLLVVPAVWIALALWVRTRSDDAQGPSRIAFWTGIGILALLVIFVVRTVIVPMFGLD
jgi:hypothetical protein